MAIEDVGKRFSVMLGTWLHYNLITFLSNPVECLLFINEYGIIKISIF